MSNNGRTALKLFERMRQAKKASDILKAVAAATWANRGYRRNPGGPTPQRFREWLCECPPDTIVEAIGHLAEVLPHRNNGWLADTIDDPPGPRRIDAERRLRAHVLIHWLLYGEDTSADVVIEEVHALVTRAWDRQDCKSTHALAPLLWEWSTRSVPLRDRQLIATRERRPPRGREPLILVRGAGVLALLGQTPLEAISVDGVPFATRHPAVPGRQFYRMEPPLQRELFPGPRTLNGKATSGALLAAVAEWRLTGDERSPLRGDIVRLGHLAYALTGSTTLTESQGAVLVGGADSVPNKARFWKAHQAARYLHLVVDRKTGARIDLIHAEGQPGRLATLAAPSWWLTGMGPMAWRYSGGLFRTVTKWGSRERTIAGIEGALTWGAAIGKGRGGRLPRNVQAKSRGGAGPAVFVPWTHVLRLAGEHVDPDASTKGKHGVRYRARVSGLRKAGYFVSGGDGGRAAAGDTIEIVEQVKGSRSRRAGLVVRASARFCAVYGGGGHRTRLPASQLLPIVPEHDEEPYTNG